MDGVRGRGSNRLGDGLEDGSERIFSRRRNHGETDGARSWE